MSETGTDTDYASRRRQFLKGTSGMAILGLAGCLGDGEDDDDVEPGEEELVDGISFAVFGGGYGEAVVESTVDTFEDEYGVSMDVDHTNTREVVTQLQAGTDLDYEVVGCVPPSFYDGFQADVWQPMDTDHFENLDNLLDDYTPENEPYNPSDDEVYFVREYYGALSACYHTDYVSDVESWWDIYTDETDGSLGFYGSVKNVMAVATAHAGVDINEWGSLSESEQEDVWDTLEEINESALEWYDDPGTMTQLLTSGEALGGSQLGFRVENAREDVEELDYTIPEEGTVTSGAGYAIPDGVTGHEKYTAEKFIDWSLSETVGHEYAERLAPYRKAIQYNDLPEVYEGNPNEEYRDRLTVLDPDVFIEHRQDWDIRIQDITRG